MLHLAAYHNHYEIVKYLCENIPSMDLTLAGKIPSGSGLANQSEVSYYQGSMYESARRRPSLLSIH